MKFQSFKDSFKNIVDIAVDFIFSHKRYVYALAVFIAMILLLFNCTDPTNKEIDPMEGIYQQYTQNTNEELTQLITSYYNCYAAGDTDTLATIATPICDEEISYIQNYSQYIDSYSNIEIYTKRGLDETSYLVSVVVDLKFVDIDTVAPGFDFFYVQTNEDGNLYINNIYGSFNQANSIYEMDTDVSALIAAFVQQEDVLVKQAEVQQRYNEAVESDENLSNFINTTLQDIIVQWNIDYQAQVEAAEAEKAAQEEAEAKAAEEAAAAEAQAAAEAEEEANAFTGTVDSKVNVRASADKSSDKLGSLEAGTSIKIYAEEGDFYKFDYNGTRAYVVKSSVKVDSTDANTDDDTETTNTSGIAEGTEITLSSTVNIRSAMDSSSSKVAVAYAGEKVTVVMSYAEGWTKVKYNKKEGYVRTDLLAE